MAIARTRDEPIEVWSSLIAPDPAWHVDQQWNCDAERIHGIARWQLRQGAKPSTIMQQLNGMAGNGSQVWCDGGHYDAHWLNTLSSAAEICDLRDERHRSTRVS